MPRPRKTEPEVSLPAPKPKRTRAASTAASHKHASKKAVQTPEPSRHVSHDDIARLAYSYWEARGRQGGSPEEDWLRAERELLVAAQNG